MTTVGALLYQDDPVAGLDDRMSADVFEAIENGMGSAAKTAMATIRGELAAKAAEFLDLELTQVAAAGWSKHRELLDAARRTSGPTPEVAQVRVPLATHEMVLTRHPTIDVVVERRAIFSIEVELSVKVMIIGVAAVVRDGRIVALRGGDCDVEVGIAVEGVEVDRRKIAVQPDVLLPLGGGIPLGLPRQLAR